MVDVKTALANMPLSVSRFIALSAIALINAGVMANDRRACVERSRVVHGNGRHWRYYARCAKEVLTKSNEIGLTFEKPYVIRSDGRYKTLYTLDSFGELVPVKSFKA